MNSRSKLALAVAAALAAACTGNNGGSASTEQSMTKSMIPDGDWRMIQRDLTAERFVPLTQINRDNVANLAEDWTFQMGGGGTSVPLVVDGIMYLSNGGSVVALNADTGEEVWNHSLAPAGAAAAPNAARQGGAAPTDGARGGRGGRGGFGARGGRGGGRGGGGGGPQASARGVSYWAGNGDLAPRIVFMAGNNLMALDAATGNPAEGFGTNGSVSVGVSYGGTPTIYKNVAIIGAASSEVPQGDPGNPRAFDVRTGEKLWEFQTVPQPGQPYNDTWGDGWKDRGGTNMWALSAPVDEERGIVYLPIAGPAANYYGGDRPGNNVFGNSIVAVNAETGEYVWHFQTVHHDLWDTDESSGGVLFDFVSDNGDHVPAIAYVGKAGIFFVLNRVNGEPLIPVEERPVPQGDVPTEWYSPTQPFPVAPPPLARSSFSEDDLVTAADTTAEHAAACRDVMERSGGFYNDGPYTPFLYKAPGAPPKSTIQMQGGTGGVNWGGVTIDPATNIVYANVQSGSLVGWVEDKPPDVTYSFDAPGSQQPYDRASIDGPGPFHSFTAPLNGFNDEGRPNPGGTAPCYKPPWAELVAIDADTGEIAWRTTLGTNPNLPEGKQLVGGSGSAGPTVTAGGLVFVGATSDRQFRAFDAATGKELWHADLGGQGNANPMSYAGQSGEQHVAIVAGNMLHVYSLPD